MLGLRRSNASQALSRDDHVKGVEAAVGYGPIDNVEVELSFGRAKYDDVSPD